MRAATSADIPALIAMGRQLHAESPRYVRFEFSEAKVEALIRSMVESTLVTAAPGGVFVAEKGGTIVGMLGGFITTPYFSHDKIASDYTFYVVPEHRRKGRAAILLLRAFEAWAREQGAVDLVPGTSTVIDTESTASFYAKLGYEKQGYVFHKRIG